MKNSIFTKALSLILCVIMLAGVMTSCFDNAGNSGISTTPPTVTTPDANEDVDNGDEDHNTDDGSFLASAVLEEGDLIHGALKNGVLIGTTDGYNAILPADVIIEQGASSVALSVKEVETGSEILLDETDTALSLDVHVDGVAASNTVPMVVNLGAVLEAGLEATSLKLYHTENEAAVLMTRVDELADFAIHNQYYYNEETGEVSIFVASFSVFTAVQTTADEWDGEAVAEGFDSGSGTEEDPYIIKTAAQLVYFRNQVDNRVTYEGQYITLDKDIDLMSHLFAPIGYGYDVVFMGTFDGAGHTIYNLYQNGWDLESATGEDYTYSTAGGGLFASIKNATVKNLAMSGANVVMECVDMGTVVGYAQGTCYFENIVVTNSKLANYQRYTGGVVAEVSYGVEDSDGYSHTFTNITVDSSVKISSLWGDFDNACGGVIGGKWGDAKVLMNGVTVAAEIDAFSDVTAAYQWYAYRRCGMLIGHTEQNSPKKALNAAADFLTCVDVNVYYGDWVNYTYYQFTNQNNDKGNRYPWVRAEAGEHNGAFSNPRYGNPIVLLEDESTVNINTLELAEAHNTSKVTITFNQLYGGGQGVYGAAEHTNVNVHNQTENTVYINDNLGWSNLKLHYWYKNGDDRWTTVVEGIDMSTMTTSTGVYKLEIPAYAHGFKIVGTDVHTATVSTPEILLASVAEDSTYSISAFQLVLSIEGADDFTVNPGDWLYNTPVYNSTDPKSEYYDVIIYDKDYSGSVETNAYGVAIVLDNNGHLIKIYDGANSSAANATEIQGAFYDSTNQKTIVDTFNASTYATYAWSQLAEGETLVIFPNDGSASGSGGNVSRAWAHSLRPVNDEGSIGQVLTFVATINEGVHVCTQVCDICGGCQNWDCEDCADNRCTCLTIVVNGNLSYTTTDFIYNEAVTADTVYNKDTGRVVVYDKSYTGTFTTNEFGVAIVIDVNGRLTKGYAWDGYYTSEGKAAIHYAVKDYATTAFSDLQEGEILIIFPNDGENAAGSARTFGRSLCDNWATTMGTEVTLTGNLK